MAKRKYDSKSSDRVGAGKYEGMERRKSLESADFGMFGENRSEFANMPRELVLKEFPKAGRYSDYGLDDTIRGINRQMSKDGSDLGREGRNGSEGIQ